MSEIFDFWEKNHEEWDTMGDPKYLTGSKFNEVWSKMNISNILKPNLNILNIGVGLGYETIELSKKEVIIDVLDISKNAVNRVKDITRNQYISTDIENLPIEEYDIVVSHLVSQHMNNEDLDKQIKYVIRGLKKDGVFAMQFAFGGENEFNEPNIINKQMQGHVFRTFPEMENIVTDNGGYIIWKSDEIRFSHTKIKWYYVHIKRKL